MWQYHAQLVHKIYMHFIMSTISKSNEIYCDLKLLKTYFLDKKKIEKFLLPEKLISGVTYNKV